jgi:hypothetical protein
MVGRREGVGGDGAGRNRARIYEEHYEVYRSLYGASREAMHRLADLAEGSEGESG